MSFRVQYTEIVPGGSRYQQDESLRVDTLDQVWVYLAARNVENVRITEHTKSDGAGRLVYPPAQGWDTFTS